MGQHLWLDFGRFSWCPRELKTSVHENAYIFWTEKMGQAKSLFFTENKPTETDLNDGPRSREDNQVDVGVSYHEASTNPDVTENVQTDQAGGVQNENREQDLADVVLNRGQGFHECEVLGSGPEAYESALTWKNCTKHPGHVDFIPISKFSSSGLAQFRPRQQQLIGSLVRNLSELTVRLRVHYTSTARPNGYCFSQLRGKNILHTGTGYVTGVQPGSGPCYCAECSQSPTPNHSWHQIKVYTACHVVYNAEEARSTQVDFFYDYDDEPEGVKSRMQTVWAVNTVATDPVGDWCMLMCATHDEALARKLETDQEELRGTVLFRSFEERDQDALGICVVVSHPHGRRKHVTIGDIMNWSSQSSYTSEFLYTTKTCPGSSGAPVFCAVTDKADKHSSRWLGPHSKGGLDEDLNMSGLSINCSNTAF
ncbi:hypothetical protein PoB_005828300 [Plakobranchus ocellatus]|uniref:Serine protease n=1 Tax=Plakobranchus ocellatus TaxID=259542 RepID=A0AAV4CIG1_9GAST|nr:hypothetical protein PoB_005828300 [Plakobranchus ocellatus]